MHKCNMIVWLWYVFATMANAQQTGDADTTTLIVTTIESAPFYMRANASHHAAGYIVDLVDRLSSLTGMRMSMRVVRDGQFGTLNTVTQQYNGMIGELMRNEADMAIAPLTITENRMKVVDFTQPFMTTGLSIMLKRPGPPPPPRLTATFDTLNVFSLETSIALFVLARVSPVENRQNEPVGLLDAFYHTAATLFHHSISTRILSVVWFLFALIVVIAFVVEWLHGCVKLAHKSGYIVNVEQLAERKDITIGIVNGGSSMQWFQKSPDEKYERIWNRMLENQTASFVANYTEGIDRVRLSRRGHYAFVMESTANDYMNAKQPCDTYRMPGEPISTVNYGIAVKRGAPFKLRLDIALERLRENNDLIRLKRKWWEDKSECTPLDERLLSGTSDLIKLPHDWFVNTITALLFILTATIVLAFLLALLEFICVGCCSARKNKRPLCISYGRQCRRMCYCNRQRDYSPNEDDSFTYRNVPTDMTANMSRRHDDERIPMIVS